MRSRVLAVSGWVPAVSESLDTVSKNHDKSRLHDHIFCHVNILTGHHHDGLLTYSQNTDHTHCHVNILTGHQHDGLLTYSQNTDHTHCHVNILTGQHHNGLLTYSQNTDHTHCNCFNVPFTKAMVTCEIRHWNNFISHVTTSEIISAAERALKLFQNYFSDIEHIGRYSRTVISLWNYFEIISELFQRLK